MIHGHVPESPKCPRCSDAGASYRGRQPSAIIAHFFPSPVGWESCESEGQRDFLCGDAARGPGTTPLTSSGECQFWRNPSVRWSLFRPDFFFGLHANTGRQCRTDYHRELSALPGLFGHLGPLADLCILVRGDGSDVYRHDWHSWTRGKLAEANPHREAHYRVSRQSTAHRPPRDNGDGPRFVPFRSGKCTWIRRLNPLAVSLPRSISEQLSSLPLIQLSTQYLRAPHPSWSPA